MRHEYPPTDAVLDLSGQTAFVSGSLQHVYFYPGRPDLLIKVVRHNFAAERWTGWRGRMKRRRRIGVLGSALRTVTEHLALRNAGVFPKRHVQEFVGFVETTEGVGLVARALKDRDGNLAPTLRSLIEQGRFTADTRARLDEFLAWMLDSPLVVGDLHVGNLVLAWDAEHGERVALIDGMGDKAFIPLNSLFPSINRMNKRRRIKRFYRGLERHMARAAAGESPK